MEGNRPRVTLDDPELAGRLRYYHRSSAYARRPVAHRISHVISDITVPPAIIKKPSRQPRFVAAPAHAYPADPARRLHVAPQTSRLARPKTMPSRAARADSVATSAIPAGSSGTSKLEPLRYSGPTRIWRRLARPIQTRLVPLAKIMPKRPTVLYSLAGVLVLLGLAVVFNGWQANGQVVAQVKHLQKQATVASATAKPAAASSNPVPATTPVTKAVRSNYVVAPDLPRYLIIPKIHVDARVLQVGVTSSGALGTPPNIYDTAWYTGSAKPGEPGATLIDGHLDGAYAAGVFWNLHKLAPGDQIQIQKGDSSVINYTVVKTQAFSVNDSNMMSSAITPVVPGHPGLNLITCDGSVGKSTNWNYSQRLVVYAEQV